MIASWRDHLAGQDGNRQVGGFWRLAGGELGRRNAECGAVAAEAGELMRLVAAGLAWYGWGPGVAGIQDGRLLPITVPGARCALTIDDRGAH
jgi:hypothetical protein